MDSLYKKYDINAPRYTSYPAMPFWNRRMDESLWVETLRRGLEETPELDLYIHIPFCEKLCWYCGCNRVITKSDAKAEAYVERLIKEYRLYLKLLPNFTIRSVHFGGGTPNFLHPDLLGSLIDELAPRFSKDKFEGAIEADPRTCFPEHLDVLAGAGFKRISFGVQDFDRQVQEAINRVQPFDLVQRVLNESLERGFEHVNFDLIWGLPKQSVATVKRSIELVAELDPDQISYYSYAHLPEKFKHQKLIKAEDILQGKEKRELYDQGKKLLEAAGYVEIGMDHYAKQGSILQRAASERRLKRNFMGYTDQKSPNLLGLGASSISNTRFGYAQNEKSVEEYQSKVDQGALPFGHGHLNGAEDEVRDQAIQELMCNLKIDAALVGQLANAEEISLQLKEFVEDGLLLAEKGRWLATSAGRMFIRSMAVVFDEYFAKGAPAKTFSRTV